MTEQKKIQSALNDLKIAEDMHRDADKIYYRAKKQLESICSPAGPLLTKKSSGIISRRRITAYRKTGS